MSAEPQHSADGLRPRLMLAFGGKRRCRLVVRRLKARRNRFADSKRTILREDGMIAWISIDQPDDPNQQKLFAQSERIYRALFNPEFTEPWKYFAKYIKDTVRRRAKKVRQRTDDYYEDFYYVGVIDGLVCGMMFFTGYADSHGFVAYMGILRELDGVPIERASRTELLDKMPTIIATRLGDLGCGYYLFELEKVRPEDLGTRRRDAETERDRNIAERITITNAFQRRGARKLGWITYRQPKLSWERDDQEVPMHLMYVPTSRFRTVPDQLSRDAICKIVRFVYLQFYMDGFNQTTHEPPQISTPPRKGPGVGWHP